MRIRGNPALASGCFRPHGCLQADGLVRHGASVAEPVERFKYLLTVRARCDEIANSDVDTGDLQGCSRLQSAPRVRRRNSRESPFSHWVICYRHTAAAAGTRRAASGLNRGGMIPFSGKAIFLVRPLHPAAHRRPPHLATSPARTQRAHLSGRQDSNLRPLVPQTSAHLRARARIRKCSLSSGFGWKEH